MKFYVYKFLRVMKLTFVFLISAFLQVSAGTGYAQKLTLVEKNATLEQTFKKIRLQTGYNFLYTDEMLRETKNVDLNFKDASLAEVLDKCFEEQPLTYSIKKKTIVIKRKAALSLALVITINGVVTDEKAEPIPGVIVKLKGTALTAVTDNNGKYSIKAPEASGILVYSFIGYITQEIPITSAKAINVILKEQITNLNQLVVVGYGEVKRGDLTGSISSVKAEDIVKSTDMSLNQALQGRAAGVQVTSTEGAPGAEVSITIRGGSSISASNEPLYVIDGFPQFGGSNLDINSNDVASVEILKDASATAIYGSRGANGVVIITTKSAQAGKFSVNYDSFISTQKIVKKLDVLNTAQFAEAQHYILSSPPGSDNEVLGTTNKYNFRKWQTWGDSTAIDWQDQVYREPIMQSHNLSFNGGAKEVKFSGSLSYTNQDGIAVGTDFNRFTGRVNAITMINKNITNGTVIYLSNTNRNGPSLNGGTGIAYSILQASPYVMDGQLLDLLEQDVIGDPTNNVSNPVKELTEPKLNAKTFGGSFSTYLQIKFLKNFSLNIRGAARYDASESSSFYSNKVATGRLTNGRASIGSNTTLNWVNENTLTYFKDFDKRHKLTAVIGYTMQNNIQTSFGSAATNFSLQSLGYNNLALGEQGINIRSDRNNSGLASFLGRANYAYLNKYLVTLSLRSDGSSKFQQDKWGYFPSAAFAWKVTDEPFMKKIEAISTLKLRTSWGMTGNQSVPPYSSYTRYISYKPIMNEILTVGLSPALQEGNKDLKWETTIQSNIGLDLGLAKNRILFTVDAYYKKSKDLLLNSPISYYSGYTSVFRNIGDIEVKGLELDVNTVNLTGKVGWNSNFNIAFNRGKVLALNEGQGFFTIGDLERRTGQYVVQVGQPLGTMFGYIYDGIFNTQEELMAGPSQGASSVIGGKKYKDVGGANGVPDGLIDQFDKTVIGNGNPKFFGGFSNDFSYKNFELSALFTFSYGNDIINSNKGVLERPSGGRGGLVAMMDHWTPENPQVNMPKWGTSVTEFDVNTSYLVEDGSYLRLKTLLLGYSIPETALKKFGVKKVRVYLSATNLWTLTKYSGYDPEVSYFNSIITPGADMGAYPRSKMYTLGLNFNL
jgi:TonB-linked SusC/RagA family outer membrane protein